MNYLTAIYIRKSGKIDRVSSSTRLPRCVTLKMDKEVITIQFKSYLILFYFQIVLKASIIILAF